MKQHTSWKILSSVIDIFHIPTQKISQKSLLLSAVQATREISHIILEAELLPDLNMTSIQISIQIIIAIAQIKLKASTQNSEVNLDLTLHPKIKKI